MDFSFEGVNKTMMVKPEVNYIFFSFFFFFFFSVNNIFN